MFEPRRLVGAALVFVLSAVAIAPRYRMQAQAIFQIQPPGRHSLLAQGVLLLLADFVAKVG
jgi:hypothetical protein